MRRFLPILILILTLLPLGAGTTNALAMSAEEIIRNSQAAFFYQGNDFKARVTMRLLSSSGSERIREMTMLRKNYGQSGEKQRYFIYFFQPSDVKDMTFMVYKYPKKDSDRWLFVPALNMVRRIAAQDKHSSFVGSDFTYEDISGRNADEDTHSIVREEKLGEVDCHVVKSIPKAGDMDYGYKLSWIDKKGFLPLREEYYDKREALYKVFTAQEIKDIKGFQTVTKRTMKNLQSGHSTEVLFSKVDYNIGIEDSLFSERYLRQPPRKWIE